MKYLLTLTFDGSSFHGSQLQPGQRTIQGELEKALGQILRQKLTITSCSRTDAGVHANMFCCTFRYDSDFETERLVCGLNAVMCREISVTSCRTVSDEFHAQKSCIKKEYIYKIYNGKQRNPFAEKYALHFERRLDESFLDAQAKQFVGTFDFSAFCSSGSSANSKIRTIFDAGVKREGNYVIFHVCGNGFLYNMVRIMVGTLLDISDGKISPDSIPTIIESKNRALAGKTAKPDGLYLNKVYYGHF